MKSFKALANPFQFDGHDIHVAVDQDQNVWFNLVDIVTAMQLQSLSTSGAELIPNHWRVELPGTDIEFINEPGVFKLIFQHGLSSNLQIAEWIVSDVMAVFRRNNFFNELTPEQRLDYGRRIDDLVNLINQNKSVSIKRLLVSELTDCCNLVGRQLPADVLSNTDDLSREQHE